MVTLASELSPAQIKPNNNMAINMKMKGTPITKTFISFPSFASFQMDKPAQQPFRSSKKFKRNQPTTSTLLTPTTTSTATPIFCQAQQSSNFSQFTSELLACQHQAPDPTYLEDDQVFYNLILKETNELKRRKARAEVEVVMELELSSETSATVGMKLSGQKRHAILSWMLKVCDHEMCQDEIFPLATMILDKFLALQAQTLNQQQKQQNPPKHYDHQKDNDNDSGNESCSAIVSATSIKRQLSSELESPQSIDMDTASSSSSLSSIAVALASSSPSPICTEFECNEAELNQRQLCLFAACSLLLATKLRQTPRLCVQALVEFSKDELPVELSRREILDGELLVLSVLKWDLAALVTPNDFLVLLLRKYNRLLLVSEQQTSENNFEDNVVSCNQRASESKLNENENENDRDSDSETENDSNNNDNNIDHDVKSNRNRCDESRVRRHTQTLLELCLMDSQLSQFQPSILAMASMAVAIDGLSMTEKTCWRLNEIVAQIHEATHKVNELKLMIDVACQIEKYVQKLLNSTHDD